MYYADIPGLDNILHDVSARSMGDTVLQQGENIIFKDGVVQQRSGIVNFPSSSLPFPDKITGISLYNKLKVLDRILLIFTEKDIYYYDKPSGKFKYITRIYATGTVTTSGTGYRTVTVTTGTFLNASWTKQRIYEISFDSVDPNQCTTWYNVLSVDSGTVLTLNEDAVSKTGSAYCLRLCYSGDLDNIWSVTYPYDPDTDERAMIATNGVDLVQKWGGSGQCVDLTAYPNYCQNICSFGSIGYHHIFCSSVYDTGSATWFRQTIEISDAGALTWIAGMYYELIDKEYEIKGILPIGSQLAIYSSNSISVGQIGTAVDPLVINENVVRNIGTPSIRTVVDIGQRHIFWSGNSIFQFDGIQTQDIGKGNSQYIVKNVNNLYQHRSFAMHLPEQNLYCLFLPWQDSTIPNMCIVLNYKTGQWNFWQFKDIANAAMYLAAQGEYIKTYMPTWDDLILTPTGTTVSGSKDITVSDVTGLDIGMRVIGSGITDISYITAISGSVITIDNNATASASSVDLTIGFTWASLTQRWTDLIVNENFARMIFGDSNGYLYEYSEDNVTDAGFAITSSLVTKDYPLNRIEYDFRLLETILQLRLKESPTGYYSASLTIRASIDAGRTWTAWQTVTLDGNSSYMEKKVNWNMLGKHCRFEIAFSNPLIIETLRIGFNADYKSMKFDN